MSAYRKDFVKTKCISFLIEDDEILKKHNEISKKFENSPKKEFDSEPVYNENFLNAKIKSYNGKINTHFHDNKVQKEGFQFICLLVILIDSVFRTSNNYYPQVFFSMLLKKKRFLSIFLMI